jgi:hypothetical protein
MGGNIADCAVKRRCDLGERKVALGHLQRRDEFAALLRGFEFLGLEDLEIGLGAVERRGRRGRACPGRGERSYSAVAVGGRLLEALLRAEVRLRQLVRPVVFERRPLDVSLGGLHLRAGRRRLGRGLGDDRSLGVDLTGEPLDRRVLRADARPRPVDRVLIVPVVDRDQKVALVNNLILDDRNLGHVPARLGGDDRRQGADIGVVG